MFGSDRVSQDQSARISAIIQSRKPRAARVRAARERLAQLILEAENFQALCRRELNGEAAEGLEGVKSACEMSVTPLEKVRQQCDVLRNLENRLDRDTLNIAVVGRARQGKSQLLQTITGLSSVEIPTGSSQFCTGVRSDIINDPSAKEAYAIVYYLSEDDFIRNVVNPYFEKLKNVDKSLVAPRSLADFRAMTLPERGAYKQSDMNKKLDYLHELKDDLAKYQDYLRGGTERIDDCRRIREYVAQDDEEGRRVYFKYLAVDHVEIFCRFPKVDVGNLRLIDLPGLGDIHEGDVERMGSALKDQVDLIFFVRKPSPQGDSWLDTDHDLYDRARSVLGDALPIEKWSFWMFNCVSAGGEDNEQQCKILCDAVERERLSAAKALIVDAKSKDDVSKKLIHEALAFLADNLERNDELFANNVQIEVTSAVEALRSVLGSAVKLLSSDPGTIDEARFGDLFDELWEELKIEVDRSVDRNSQLRAARELPCEPLKNEIDRLLDEADREALTSLSARSKK